MGWIYESIFCTIKGKKWENRGFLFGPVCPIYGAGGVGITGIADLIAYYTDSDFVWWQIFLVAFFGSIVLEYSTSWALEKLFHAYWWDYSNMPLNINGRVCFPYSVCFGLAGLLVIYGIAPFTKFITGWISPILYELFALLFMGIVSVDAAITVSALTDFARTVTNMQENFNERMEGFVSDIQKKRETEEKTEDDSTQSGILERTFGIEEKKRALKANAENAIDSMGALKKAALGRAQGFKYPKIENKYIDTFAETLKSKLVKKKPDKTQKK